jgi:hypothetical protein
MPNWNPTFPSLLGLEWLANWDHKVRVWGAAPARMARRHSTVTETINALKLSAAFNPLERSRIYTLIDVIEEGQELAPQWTDALLPPVADKVISGWRRENGLAIQLYESLNNDPEMRWPGPSQTQWIEAKADGQAYEFSVDASAFALGGALRGSRVGWVAVHVISSANTGVRNIFVSLRINGVEYVPGGGPLRETHVYGLFTGLWWGELNPATEQPWTPADIANFGPGGTSRILIGTNYATPDHYPRIHAVQMQVPYANPENRVAVGVWNRPSVIAARLTNVTTDALLAMPAGTSGWAKVAGKRYLFYWRHSINPALGAAVQAEDVLWNGIHQVLPSNGKPPGPSYPLAMVTATDVVPYGVMADQEVGHDTFGRPFEAFTGPSPNVAGIALVRADAAISVDSQPYRLDITDCPLITPTQRVGQRVTPATTQTYQGVRFVIVPPYAGNPTLTVAVHRVSDGVLMGGTFSITANEVRALPEYARWRFVSGVLSSAAALIGSTQYEIRLTTTAGASGSDVINAADWPSSWLVPMPDASLGVSASFGGTTSGGVLGTTFRSDRDLPIVLVQQPNPPTAATATVVDIPLTTVSGLTTIKHVRVDWTPPASGLGAAFANYDLERSLDGGTWHDVMQPLDEVVRTFVDHEVPRVTSVRYRVRSVAIDGRFSAWAESNAVTVPAQGAILILTSNHRSDLEAVFLYDPDSRYPILSATGDEFVAIHGANYQVSFEEVEDRGIAWSTRITLNQVTLVGKGGQHVLTRLLRLIRSGGAVPYVCALDDQGTQLLGKVALSSDPIQQQPWHRYTTEVTITPTHTAPVPPMVAAMRQEDQTLVAFGVVRVQGTVAQFQQNQTLFALGTVT